MMKQMKFFNGKVERIQILKPIGFSCDWVPSAGRISGIDERARQGQVNVFGAPIIVIGEEAATVWR